MKLPPYQQMPPEVRMRLRQRVLPPLSSRPGNRVPYMVAAAIVVVAAAALALLMSPARNVAPPASQAWTSPTGVYLRVSGTCNVGFDDWQAGAHLRRSNGDDVQLGIKDHGVLGVCLLTSSHPTPSSWFTMVPWDPDPASRTFRAQLSGGLVYGTIGPSVRSVTVDGVPAVVANGTFVAEVDLAKSATVTTLDAQGHILDQGTIS